MKKLAILVAVAMLLVAVVPALAGAKNATFLEWTWKGNKSGYFMKTGSGLVHLWYDQHPTYEGTHAIFKPLSHFKNAAENGCGEGVQFERTNWQSQNLYNAMDTDKYKAAFEGIFIVPTKYLLCIY